MAFTTNGNMHRHMRIHEKEQNPDGIAVPQRIRKKKRATIAGGDPASGELDLSTSSDAIKGAGNGLVFLKRKLHMGGDDAQPVKRAFYEMEGIDFCSPEKSTTSTDDLDSSTLGSSIMKSNMKSSSKRTVSDLSRYLS